MLIIEKKKIEELKKKLSEKNNLIDTRKDVLPFKQYFFPPSEETFVFDKESRRLRVGTSTGASGKNSFILFGLNLRETEALIQLDEIMKKDFFYCQKRNAATIVSITEEDGPLYHVGIDLILEALRQDSGQEIYKAHCMTKKGQKIIRSKLFKEVSGNQYANNQTKQEIMPELRKLLLNPELLKNAVEWSWNPSTDSGQDKIWDSLAKKCLGCGICTYVCPLCHCFSTEDRRSLDGAECSKTRRWAACTLPEFSRIAGGLPIGRQGHNFHPTLKERYYNWFYHKFVRAYNEYGKSQCVACGKCKKNCPAGISIEEILVKIVEKYGEFLSAKTS